jgi:hypothetical protein
MPAFFFLGIQDRIEIFMQPTRKCMSVPAGALTIWFPPIIDPIF